MYQDGGLTFNGLPCVNIEEFVYSDPKDNTFVENQGYIMDFRAGERVVFRTSGTGSSSATIRIYLEHYHSRPDMLFRKTGDVLKQVVGAALEACNIVNITGMKEPSVIT
jgi:phosphoglucomutase